MEGTYRRVRGVFCVLVVACVTLLVGHVSADASLYDDALDADDDYSRPDAQGTFVLEQSVGADSAFTKRGVINVDSLRTASKGFITQTQLTDTQKEELMTAAQLRDIVRVRIREEGGEEPVVMSFVPACNLVASDLMDSVVLHISRDLKPVAISYQTKEKVCRPGKKLTGKSTLRTRVVVMRAEDAPLPTTDGHQAPTPQVSEGQAGTIAEDGKPKEEPGFFSKYWHIIVMAVLWFNLRSSRAEEEEGEQGKNKDKKKEE